MSEIQNLPENASKNAGNILIYAVCTYRLKLRVFTYRLMGRGGGVTTEKENRGIEKVGVWKILPLVFHSIGVVRMIEDK